MSDQRPDPEKLLQRVQEEERKEQRGKLKIYIGAAPGIGKTYEMLKDALEERVKGLDIVIGIAESHQRREIESMLKDFEILPRQEVLYHGKQLLEFDLDLALKRHPALILIDEMAHTNAPGLRHQKRWQDIKELLDRGINVNTTINVQHIESLNDDVAQIIGATIKETVPDSMIEMANTIELVDLPPEELLKRLQEGKVYLPEQASLAEEYYFRKSKLTALRELALRTTAERVGSQVLLYRQGENIQHIWPIKEKLLVCVSPGTESIKLIRAAKRMATNLQAEWIAVYVDRTKLKSYDESRNGAIKNLRFAEKLGAETRILTGLDIVKEIMKFAHEQNITQIMIWKTVRTRWRNLFFRNLADEIVRHSGEIDVYIMTGVKANTQPQKFIANKQPIPWPIYLITIGIVSIATVINFMLYPFLNTSNLVMVYLLGVVIFALYGKIGPSLLGSALSVLAYDFFFIPPFYSFAVSDVEYFFTLIVMLLVAYVISHLTILTRRQLDAVRFSEKQINALHTLTRRFASTRGVDNLLNLGTKYIADIFNCEVIVLLPNNNKLSIYETSQNIVKSLNIKEQGIAQWVYELGQIAGLGTDTLPFSNSLYIPLIATHGTIGVLQIHPIETKRLLSPEEMDLLESCVNQIAVAIESDGLQEKN